MLPLLPPLPLSKFLDRLAEVDRMTFVAEEGGFSDGNTAGGFLLLCFIASPPVVVEDAVANALVLGMRFAISRGASPKGERLRLDGPLGVWL